MAELSYLCLSLIVKHWCIYQHQHKVPFQFNVIRYLSRINPPSKGFQTHRLLYQILIPKTNLLIRFVVFFGINNGRDVWFKYFVKYEDNSYIRCYRSDPHPQGKKSPDPDPHHWKNEETVVLIQDGSSKIFCACAWGELGNSFC